MPTRFWCSSHLSTLRSYRLNGVPLNRHIRTSHITHRNKISIRKEISPLGCIFSRDASQKRGARLRWAYEHEKLTNISFQDVESFHHIMDVDSSGNAENMSTFEPVTLSPTVRQWAHQRN